MRTPIVLLLGCLLFVAASMPTASAQSRALSDEEWSADVRQLAAAIRDIHFKPFHVTTEASFDTAIEDLEARLGELSDAEIIVEMAGIVAALRDGHTRLHIPRLYPELALPAELGHTGTPPPKVASLMFRQLPVSFGLFDDGLFVIAATAPYQHLVGQQVTHFDNSSAEDAVAMTATVSYFENRWRAMLMAPDRLALPQVTAALGISDSSDAISLTTRNADGETATTLPSLTAPGERFESAIDNTPLWQRNQDEYRWFEVLPDRDAIYVQVNEFEENPVSPYGDFVAETISAARQAKVSRYVLDLRHNFGGIGAWTTPFVTGLLNSEFNEYGRLYVLTGRTSFSASQFLIHKFEELTYAMFVGEPSGAKPSHFGDARRITLENSGLSLRVSTIYWHSWLANDFRDAINPHLSVPMQSSDFFDGHDPVLESALTYEPPATLAGWMDEQFRQEKNQNALLLYSRYMSDATIDDHRQVIPDLLAMADALVEDGIVRPGYFVYFLVNMSYPGIPAVEAGLERIQGLLE